VSKSSDIAATTDPSRVKLGFFEELGLKNSFVIGLYLQCRRTRAGPRLSYFTQYFVYVHVNGSKMTVYVTENTVFSRIKTCQETFSGSVRRRKKTAWIIG